MCGITAFSRANGSTSIPDGYTFAVASLLAIESRGPHSTGAAWTAGRQRDVWYDKLVGPARQVATKLEIDRQRKLHTFIGHTRYATQGEHTYDNAHPVVADHIVAVHNGVLTNDDTLVKLAERDRVGEVDSWAIAGLLANMTALGASHPSEVLDLVQGRAAVAWLDADDPKALWLACLHGSPMTIGWTRRGDLVMSSTRQTLRMTERLAKVTIGDVIDVPEGAILRVVGGHIVEWTGTPKPAPKAPVRRPLWTPTKGSPAPRYEWDDEPEWADGRGVTDWFDRRGNVIANEDQPMRWPTGVEIIAERRARERAEARIYEGAFDKGARHQNGSRKGR